METHFIPAATSAPKSHRTQHSTQILTRECEVMPHLKRSHSPLGRLIGTGLANGIPKPCGREVGPQDNQGVMIKLHEAGVSKDGFLQIVHGPLSGIHPDWCNRVDVIAVGDKLAQRSHPQLKVVNEFAVELHKPDELGNISN
jgi:hypothetical protein